MWCLMGVYCLCKISEHSSGQGLCRFCILHIFIAHLTDVPSFQEKFVHGLLITAGVLAYPVYAMYQVAAVKREEYAAMEIPEEWQAWKERQTK